MNEKEELKKVKTRLWRLQNRFEGTGMNLQKFSEEIYRLCDIESDLCAKLGLRKIVCDKCQDIEMKYVGEGSWKCLCCKAWRPHNKGVNCRHNRSAVVQ